MKDIFLDVHLELDLHALSQVPDPDTYVLGALRHEADTLCAKSGARLRTDRAPEIIVSRGQNKVTQQMCVLVASRWAVVAPETVEMKVFPR